MLILDSCIPSFWWNWCWDIIDKWCLQNMTQVVPHTELHPPTLHPSTQFSGNLTGIFCVTLIFQRNNKPNQSHDHAGVHDNPSCVPVSQDWVTSLRYFLYLLITFPIWELLYLYYIIPNVSSFMIDSCLYKYVFNRSMRTMKTRIKQGIISSLIVN